MGAHGEEPFLILFVCVVSQNHMKRICISLMDRLYRRRKVNPHYEERRIIEDGISGDNSSKFTLYPDIRLISVRIQAVRL